MGITWVGIWELEGASWVIEIGDGVAADKDIGAGLGLAVGTAQAVSKIRNKTKNLITMIKMIRDA